MQRSALCRSRRELSNEYLLAKIGVDTAENEPLEVWGKYSILFTSVLILEMVKAVHLALFQQPRSACGRSLGPWPLTLAADSSSQAGLAYALRARARPRRRHRGPAGHGLAGFAAETGDEEGQAGL